MNLNCLGLVLFYYFLMEFFLLDYFCSLVEYLKYTNKVKKKKEEMFIRLCLYEFIFFNSFMLYRYYINVIYLVLSDV